MPVLVQGRSRMLPFSRTRNARHKRYPRTPEIVISECPVSGKRFQGPRAEDKSIKITKIIIDLKDELQDVRGAVR